MRRVPREPQNVAQGRLLARRGAATVALLTSLLGSECSPPRSVPTTARLQPPSRPVPAAKVTVRAHEPAMAHVAYQVRVDGDPAHLAIKLCPEGFRLTALRPPRPGARAALRGAKIFTPEGDFPCGEEGLDLPALALNECLEYAVDLNKSGAQPSSLQQADDDLLASPDEWLWVPEPRPPGLGVSVQFELPEGLFAAFPWPRMAADWAPAATAFTWKSAGAFTHRAPLRLAVAGAELDVALLGAGFDRPADLEHWISEGARASAGLFGRFPLPRALVIAVPSERTGPAFGMALRGGGPAVVIFVDRHASTASLASDWTCAHEFLHLGVPRLPPEDAWFFEGLATYYAEVTRARAGQIRAAQAYQHLLDGFARGQAHGTGRTLREESAEMRENHAFYRVYWAGAALAFLVDVEARRARGPSLDHALREFARRSADSEEDWTAERVMTEVDAALGAARYATLAKAWLDRKEFPDLASTVRALGIARGTRGDASYGPAVDAALRDAIMAKVASDAQ